MNEISRREFMRRAGLATGMAGTLPTGLAGENSPAAGTPKAESPDGRKETYETHAKGIRIVPGQWRPHYPWEHIVWISPSWPSQDYLWLDYPEAIFTSQGLLYLSHINPPIRAVYRDWPRVEWAAAPSGLTYERQLPNGVRFGGKVTRKSDTVVALELELRNGSTQPLANISLQTCAFLRGIKEFAEYTRGNKYVHVANRGWVTVEAAAAMPEGPGPYRLGWRKTGKLLADWPVIATVSNQAERLVAMTWGQDTLSLVSNPRHPCMHADPQFKDLAPGESATIHGKIVFFEGKLGEFDLGRLNG